MKRDNIIGITDPNQQANYYKMQVKVTEYALDFFAQLINDYGVRDKIVSNILPITCRNKYKTISKAMIDKTRIASGEINYTKGKQAIVYIDINPSSTILTKTIKETIRHEVIHYFLWLLDIPNEDDSLEFWCNCFVYKARAYMELDYDNNRLYEIFVSYHSRYCKDNLSKDIIQPALLNEIIDVNKSDLNSNRKCELFKNKANQIINEITQFNRFYNKK